MCVWCGYGCGEYGFCWLSVGVVKIGEWVVWCKCGYPRQDPAMCGIEMDRYKWTPSEVAIQLR